ncbi:TPA: hypothetical protein ACH3X1_002842 [Trebouxia sp. C0004]
MSVTGAATEEDSAEVGEHMGTGWQLFDEYYLAMHHRSPTDPSHQQALGLVDESNLTDSDEQEGAIDASSDEDRNEVQSDDDGDADQLQPERVQTI